MGLISAKTVQVFADAPKMPNCNLNGPMGVFEFEKFANGTKGCTELQMLMEQQSLERLAAAVKQLGFAPK